MFVREGAAIPLNIAEQHFRRRADERAFAVFPPLTGRVVGACFEDDGEGEAYRSGGYGLWRIEVDASPERLSIQGSKAGPTPPAGDRMTLLLPLSETRAVEVAGGQILSDAANRDWRSIVVAVL